MQQPLNNLTIVVLECCTHHLSASGTWSRSPELCSGSPMRRGSGDWNLNPGQVQITRTPQETPSCLAVSSHSGHERPEESQKNLQDRAVAHRLGVVVVGASQGRAGPGALVRRPVRVPRPFCCSPGAAFGVPGRLDDWVEVLQRQRGCPCSVSIAIFVSGFIAQNGLTGEDVHGCLLGPVCPSRDIWLANILKSYRTSHSISGRLCCLLDRKRESAE